MLCNKDLSIVAIVELDHATHQRKDRQIADAKKDKALASAGIRIVRFRARALPDRAIIQSTFMSNHGASADPREKAGQSADQTRWASLAERAK